MQITHEEARRLIQFKLDKTLKPQEINTLQTHLNDCLECRAFAEEIKEVDALLLPTMRKHWNLQPRPLSVAAIHKKQRLQSNIILATRTAIMSLIFGIFVFSAWQFTVSNSRTATPMPVSVLPIPTPSSQSTSTMISSQNCQEMVYEVQENDTLESIALQFAVSKAEIMEINRLTTEAVNTKMKLLVPGCHSTPTGTLHPSTLTTTFTPVTDSIMSTPGG